MVIIYKFCKNEIRIQPPGEPQEHHLGEVRQKSSCYKNFIKDKMTGRVDIVWRTTFLQNYSDHYSALIQ